MSTTVRPETRFRSRAAPVADTGTASAWSDPRYQAFWMLRLGYTAIPIVMGVDKFFNGLVYWPQYLADWINDIAPGTAQQFMYSSVYDPPLRLGRAR